MLDAFCIETAYEIASCMPLSMKNRFLALLLLRNISCKADSKQCIFVAYCLFE